MSHGLCSQIRYLSASLRADRNHLENAPLGPIQKKRLAGRIEHTAAELKEARAKLKAIRAQNKAEKL